MARQFDKNSDTEKRKLYNINRHLDLNIAEKHRGDGLWWERPRENTMVS